MASPLFSNKAFIWGGSIFFALWVLGPLFLILVSYALNRSGGNIDLWVGFLLMISLAGMVFLLAFALAVKFNKPWLMTAPVIYLVVSSFYRHLFPSKKDPTVTTVFVTEDSPQAEPARQLAESSGTSIESMLLFAKAGMSPKTAEAVSRFVEKRQDELAGQISKDKPFSIQALYAASVLTNPAPAVIEAVKKEGDSYIQSLRRFNELNVASDCTHLAPHLRERFFAWSAAMVSLHLKRRIDATESLKLIQGLAGVRAAECPAMAEIQSAARSALSER